MNNSIRYAIACRMVDGWKSSVSVSDGYEDIKNLVHKENSITTKMYSELKGLIRDKFMTFQGYSNKIDEKLEKSLSKWKNDFEVGDIVSSWGYHYSYVQLVQLGQLRYDFIDYIILAEESLNFADQMIDAGKESIILTLPVNREIVEAHALYEKNRDRLRNFKEIEFTEDMIEVESYRNKLCEIREVVENLLGEREKQSVKESVLDPVVSQESTVSDRNSTTANEDMTFCTKISNWWRSV